MKQKRIVYHKHTGVIESYSSYSSSVMQIFPPLQEHQAAIVSMDLYKPSKNTIINLETKEQQER